MNETFNKYFPSGLAIGGKERVRTLYAVPKEVGERHRKETLKGIYGNDFWFGLGWFVFGVVLTLVVFSL